LVVEVDDSGWGDLLGGVVIVLRRRETGERHIGLVPLEYFRHPNFKHQEYLGAATQAVLDGLESLKVKMDEPIHMCTGYIFTGAREMLRELGYDVRDVRITGATQELAESEYVKSLVAMGVGKQRKVASMRSFNGFLGWVMEDLAARERYVKTGWSSWNKYRGGGH
jgi:hypothetical protein